MRKKVVVDQDKLKKMIEERYPLIERPEVMDDLDDAYIKSQKSILLEEVYFYMLYEYIVQLEKDYKRMRQSLIRYDIESLTVSIPKSATEKKNK